MIIRKVFKTKRNNQKLITIPRDCDINEGDFVEITKVTSSRANVQFQDKEEIDWKNLNKKMEVLKNDSN